VLGPATVEVVASTIGSNLATSGGGIYNTLGTVTVSNCALNGNSFSASNGGGALYKAGSAQIFNSTLSGNFSVQQCSGGGAIYNIGSPGREATLQIVGSTLSSNLAGCFGGGIFNDGYSYSASATIANSTISGNWVQSGDGGGIF